jgi:hypothetical protein
MILSLYLIYTSLSIGFNENLVEWITPTTHSFGTILRGQEQTVVFEFVNQAAIPLVVDNVRTECGCTATEWEETPVLSKQKGQIKVRYDALKKGYFKKKITVWLHGQRKPEKLWIEGEVE